MALGEPELPDHAAWLTAREASRAEGIRFTKRRGEYLLRRWVCKHAVAEVAGLPADPDTLARIEVGNLPSGAPCVYLDGARSDLEVSLTDRAGWAVCLVGTELGRLGCDLEIVEPRSDGFLTDFLTTAEQAYVGAVPRSDRDAAANLVWSAKESALKVLHTGLRRDTRTVEVGLGGGAPTEEAGGEAGWSPLEVVTAEGVRLPGWWRRERAFLLTVAAETPMPAPRRLTGSADLATAVPVHSWVDRPVAE
jgi:4'-phosphopantetheinyl transferase